MYNVGTVQKKLNLIDSLFYKRYDYFRVIIIYNIVYYYQKNSNKCIIKKVIKRNSKRFRFGLKSLKEFKIKEIQKDLD